MKKFFTLICALVATVAASAATIDDVAVCKHSYVLVMDDVTNNGAAKSAKGSTFGDGFFLEVTGGSVSTGKKSVNPAAMTQEKDADGNPVGDPYYTYGEAFAKKYADYAGDHLNSYRIKNGQDQFALKMTAGSKLIILGQVHSSRYPTVALAQADNTGKNAPIEGEVGKLIKNDCGTTGYFEWQALQDVTIYVGSFGGDYYIGMVIIEANEAAGTPSVKASAQQYDGGEGMWYSLVTCKPVAEVEGIPTCCTYTTDGSEPTAESPVYKEPIKVYKNCVVKFQAFYDYDGVGSADDIITDAANDAIVTFNFAAPTIKADGAEVTITAAEEGAVNYYKINDGEWTEGDSFTLTESATVSAMSKYDNGEDEDENPIVFESKPVSKDVYVLTPITEKQEIVVSAGKVVVDEEATASSTDGSTIYKVEGGEISADKKFFFVKDLVFGVVNGEKAQYQVPAGQEAYIQMNGNIEFVFELAEKACVTITATKNSCKNLETDPMFSIGVDGVNNGKTATYASANVAEEYELLDPESGEVVETLPGNVIKFNLEAGVHHITRYTGTGQIFLSSIVIEPGKDAYTGVSDVVAAEAVVSNVAKIATANGIKIVKGNAAYNVAGAQMK